MASRPNGVRPGSRLRQIGWAFVLGLCVAIFLALTFKVNAVKSEVRLTERQIIAMEREALMLETEFQTRSSQRQLSNWNAVEFGYVAPSAANYLDNERELAKLGSPRGLEAPDPIRIVRSEAPKEEESLFAEWVAPTQASAAEIDRDPRATLGGEASSLAQRLSGAPALGMALAEGTQ